MSHATTPATASPSPLIAVKPRRFSSEKVVSNVTLIVIGIVFAAPLLWLLFASVDAKASAALQWPTFTLSNFTAAATDENLRALWNSAYISFIATLVATIPATMAAYALSRHHIPWKGPLLLLILMLSGVPITIMIIPLYEQFLKFGLLTMVPAAIFLGVTSLPFEIWIIKNFIDSVPTELDEAARLEGAKTWHVLGRVVLPAALPGIAVAAIFGFINAWGNFLVPLVMLPNPTDEPSPVAIYGFFGGQGIRFGQVAAYSIMYSLPILVLYLGMSRLFRGGFSLSGAIRG
jgi:multiple sugar transport system permease protein